MHITYYPIFAILLCFLACPLEAKSDADRAYASLCKKAGKDMEVLHHFKRHPACHQFSEDSSKETGGHYLAYIIKHYPELIPLFDRFRENDRVGDPLTYDYEEFGFFAPSTLKYIKIAGDIKKSFGDIRQLNVVELGGNLGGQCKILAQCGGFGSYTIVEIPEACTLTRKFLDLLNLPHVHVIKTDEISQLPPCDLVISHGASFEINKKNCPLVLNAIIRPAPRGYLVLNTENVSLSADQLTAHLYALGKKGSLKRETPLLDSNHRILSWNNAKNFISQKPAPELQVSENPQSLPAVSYSFSGGRFGDNLVSYLHAKWISFKYGLPFLYRPFPSSDQLKMDGTAQQWGAYTFASKCIIRTENEFATLRDSTLYVVPYFPECLQEFEMHPHLKNHPYFEVDWEHPEFKKVIAQALSPKNPVATLPLPKNKMTVCVHIRRGGNVDHPSMRFPFPLKFPPDYYYITQIKRIADLFPDTPLYVYLMTDDLNPAALVQSYASAFKKYDIEFDCRAEENGPKANILEDFFSLGKFDCLIRCQSNFSLMGALLGDYRILITPTHAYTKDNDIVVDNIELVFNPK